MNEVSNSKLDWMLPESDINYLRKIINAKEKKLNNPFGYFLDSMCLGLIEIREMVIAPTKTELKFVESQFLKFKNGTVDDINKYYIKNNVDRKI